MKFALFLVLLAGCNDSVVAIHRLVCTPDEMQRVESETVFCIKQSGYMPSECYRAAMNRVCTVRNTTNE